MIPGIGGDLVSHAYLEQRLLPALDRSPRAVSFERQAARWWRTVTRSIGPSAGARQVFDLATAPLLDALGFAVPMVQPVGDLLVGRSPANHEQAAVVITLAWSASMDAAWRDAVRCGVTADVGWALVTNGRSLRIVDCQRPWSKHALHFDFAALLANADGARLLWVLGGSHAVINQAGPGTLRLHVDQSNRQAARVCQSLGDGVLSALPRLASSLTAGRAPAGHSYDQALTVVYRVLFLLFAEARGLVPVWHPVYREAYTIEALYRRSVEPRAPRGLWAGLQAIARMAHAGCKAGDLDVTAFNGRLFSPRHAPLAEQHRVPEEVVKALVLALTTTDSPIGRRRIAYHDLGVEQLGAVYERVLEHEPVTTKAGVVMERTSSARKVTGSFYTPRSITEFLVRRTLHPLVTGRSAHDILALRVVDPAMGSGAFLVAACRYLAEQCEQARLRDGQWHADEVTPSDRASLRRQVAEQCLYGVDLNPTAVQLARLSLWLTTLASGKPLTFLDHHLAVGNSLVGGRLADLSKPPVRGRPNQHVPLPLFDDGVSEVARHVLPERLRLEVAPSDSLQAVREKERVLERLSAPDGPFANWSRAADAWCAAALWPGAAPSHALVREWIAALLGGATTLPAAQLTRWTTQAAEIAASHAVFHWELAFPEVFFDARGDRRPAGGFDAVLGNPPWDMLRADSGTAASRVFDRERAAPVRRFFRSTGIYCVQGHGHANRYQLFLERALQLTRPAGRVGLILPSGIATDHGSANLRRLLLDRCAIDTWLGLDNKAGIFPIHRSVRFVLIAATNDGRTEVLKYRSGLQDPSVLDRYPSDPRQDQDDRLLQVSRSRLESWDPGQLSIPELTSATALAILTEASAVAPPLGAADGWNARFGRELNATDDRAHFIPRPAHARRSLLPIIEGKHVAPFQVSTDAATLAVPLKTARVLIDPSVSFARDRIAYRDVASATNRLTLIAGLLPRHVLSTHTVFVLKTLLGADAQWCLLALLNSLVANYLVRLNVTTHVTTALMSRLPVPRPPDGCAVFHELAILARGLSRTGIEAAPDAYARLNALVATLYGLSRDHYQHVVASFPLIPVSLRSACIAAHERATETRKHGGDPVNAP